MSLPDEWNSEFESRPDRDASLILIGIIAVLILIALGVSAFAQQQKSPIQLKIENTIGSLIIENSNLSIKIEDLSKQNEDLKKQIEDAKKDK